MDQTLGKDLSAAAQLWVTPVTKVDGEVQQAHHEFRAVPIVADGKASRAVIVAPASSRVASVRELKGKRVAFGYENSTTTYLIPCSCSRRTACSRRT